MTKAFFPKHSIQEHILNILTDVASARFSDLRPPKVDTNLYSYHLKLLQKQQYVKKTDDGYSLDRNGLIYVDQSANTLSGLENRTKIIIMLVVQNSDGDVLLQKIQRQPFITQWSLPHSRLRTDDQAIANTARRLVADKLGLPEKKPEHAGDCYIRIIDKSQVIINTLVHVFRMESDTIAENDDLHWARPHKLSQYDLAPTVEQIIARTFFRDERFFEEYDVAW